MITRIELRVTEGWQSENAPPGTAEEFTLIEWKKSVGDLIERHDIIFTYDPGKVEIEYTAPCNCRLVEIWIPAGTEGCPRGSIAGAVEMVVGAVEI